VNYDGYDKFYMRPVTDFFAIGRPLPSVRTVRKAARHYMENLLKQPDGFVAKHAEEHLPFFGMRIAGLKVKRENEGAE